MSRIINKSQVLEHFVYANGVKTVLKYETDYAGFTKIVDVLTSNKRPLNSLHLNVTHRAKMLWRKSKYKTEPQAGTDSTANKPNFRCIYSVKTKK